MSTILAIASGPYLAACGLLAVTGAAKIRQPGPTSAALHAAFGVTWPDPAARAIGGAEVAVGIGAAAWGGPAACAVVALYASFLAVASRLHTRAPDVACGCIGDRSGPVGAAHLASSAAAVLVATVYAAGGGDGVARVLADQPLAGVPFAVLCATCVALVSLFMSSAKEHRWSR